LAERSKDFVARNEVDFDPVENEYETGKIGNRCGKFVYSAVERITPRLSVLFSSYFEAIYLWLYGPLLGLGRFFSFLIHLHSQ
jgi:hypothetical protein